MTLSELATKAGEVMSILAICGLGWKAIAYVIESRAMANNASSKVDKLNHFVQGELRETREEIHQISEDVKANSKHLNFIIGKLSKR